MKIATHEFVSDGSGGKGFGQTQWSAAARSADWQVTDATRMAGRVNIDHPVFQDTVKRYYFGFSPAAWAFGTAAGAEPGQLGPADVLGPVFRTVRHVDVAAIVEHLRRQGYDGWYVLEQDTILTEEPRGEGPVADVHTSAAYVQRLISGSG